MEHQLKCLLLVVFAELAIKPGWIPVNEKA